MRATKREMPTRSEHHLTVGKQRVASQHDVCDAQEYLPRDLRTARLRERGGGVCVRVTHIEMDAKGEKSVPEPHHAAQRWAAREEG